MAKTQKEKEEHQHRTMLINNSLAEEYRNWYGWPEHTNYGRYLALGEYIVELCEEPSHDEWFDAAKEAYLKWKKARGYDNTPPPSNKGYGNDSVQNGPFGLMRMRQNL